MEGACPKRDLSKVKIRRWLDIPRLSVYENYIGRWHAFVRDEQKALRDMRGAEQRKMRNMALLNIFFIENYPADRDFYEVFEERMHRAQLL